MDRAVVQLASPTKVVLEWKLVCRDCELEARHGERAMCRRIGHHGAIATSDGGHHSAALAQLPDGSIPLDPRISAWAERLARHPETSTAADIELLRAAGLDDRAILDAVLTVAYFSFVNRLVLATGLSLEPGFEVTCKSM